LGDTRIDCTTAAIILGFVGIEQSAAAVVATHVSQGADGVLFASVDQLIEAGPVPVASGARVDTPRHAAAAVEAGASFLQVGSDADVGAVAAQAPNAVLIVTASVHLDVSNQLILQVSAAAVPATVPMGYPVAVDLAASELEPDAELGVQVAAHRAGARVFITDQVQRAHRTSYTVDQLLQRRSSSVA